MPTIKNGKLIGYGRTYKTALQKSKNTHKMPTGKMMSDKEMEKMHGRRRDS